MVSDLWQFARFGLPFVLAAGMMAATTVKAEGNPESDANRELVAESARAWAISTGSPDDLLADEAERTISGGSLAKKIYPKRGAFLSEVISPFNARMATPLVPTVRKLYAEDDIVIAFFDAYGTARNGLPNENRYVWVLEFEDDRIFRANAFLDSIAFDDLWRRLTPAETPKQ